MNAQRRVLHFKHPIIKKKTEVVHSNKCKNVNLIINNKEKYEFAQRLADIGKIEVCGNCLLPIIDCNGLIHTGANPTCRLVNVDFDVKMKLLDDFYRYTRKHLCARCLVPIESGSRENKNNKIPQTFEYWEVSNIANIKCEYCENIFNIKEKHDCYAKEILAKKMNENGLILVCVDCKDDEISDDIDEDKVNELLKCKENGTNKCLVCFKDFAKCKECNKDALLLGDYICNDNYICDLCNIEQIKKM
jgi:hypothetical protein